MNRKKLIFFLLLITLFGLTPSVSAQNDVYMQGFYWNCYPGGTWYDTLTNIAAQLKSAGFSGIWIPPAAKGGSSQSMGYDIYDNYDFGEFNQKGTTKTRFGSRSQLEQMIFTYKNLGMKLYFDIVMNHQAYANQQANYTCGGGSGWVIFNPASGRFPKNASQFHPNTIHCDNNSPYHNKIFFEDICQHSSAGDSLIVWGQYITNVLGFDGFRIDAIKHIEPDYIARFSQAFPGKYLVGEHWSTAGEIASYYNQVVSNGGSVSIYDFPLRYALRDMCNNATGSYNMNELVSAGLRNYMPMERVSTFIENHDVDRVNWNGQISDGHDPITRDKMMAYAYILFMDGKPCVFYRDYFQYGLGPKIDTLIYVRNNFLSGNVLFAGSLNVSYLGNASSADVFIAKRNGNGNIPGGILILNDNATQTFSVEISTGYNNTTLKDFTGNMPNVTTSPTGRATFSVPPRGYVVYVPNTGNINRPPVITPIDTLKMYVGVPFTYRFIVSDADGDSVSVSFINLPNFVMRDGSTLAAEPSEEHIGNYSVTIVADDGNGGTAQLDFIISVRAGGGSSGFNIDGLLDIGAVQVATNNGEHLWYGWNGTELYLATEKATATTDKFIFAAIQPGALTNHPWVKQGQVALWRFYLGNEGTNGWSGFFGLLSSTQNETMAGDVLEAKLNLINEFGTAPSGIYLVAAKYATENNGALLNQVPAGNGDANISADEYIFVSLTSSSVENGNLTVEDFKLYQNYPNPFNPVTIIKYSLPNNVETHYSVSLRIYDVLGSEIAILVNSEQSSGNYEISWDAAGLPSGIYYYRLVAESSSANTNKNFIDTKKMLLLK